MLKFFNIFRKRTCVNMRQAQVILMAQISNTLIFINVIIFTVYDIFGGFILLRRHIIELIEEAT